MKSKHQILKWLAMLVILFGSMTGAWAQGPNGWTATGDETVCLNSTHNYGVPLTGGSIYSWSITPASGGTITGNTNVISVNWTQIGTYTLEVIETNSNLCEGEPTRITVIVNPLPTATIGGTLAVCQNAGAPDITFTGANGTAPYTFTYTINGGAVQSVSTTTGNSVTVSVPTATVGSFVYALTGVTDASGTTCSQAQTGNATITVNPLPVPTITGPLTVCETIAGSVYTTEANMTNYVWVISAGGTITAGGDTDDNTVTITWNTPGAQTVSVNYDNANGCEATTPTVLPVRIDALPETSLIYHD